MIDQEGINSLNTGAGAITYEGTEGPKSPEQDQARALGLPEGLTVEEAVRTFDLAFPEKSNLRGMEKLQEVIKYFRMQKSEGPPLPNDPTEPVNPFGPKPIGPPLPNRQMAAFGGIMGLDNRKQYGIGSKFKRAFNKVTKPFTKVAQKLMPKELAGIAQFAAPFAGPYGPLLMAAGQAKQKGRLNPFSLALAAAPYIRNTPGSGLSYGTAANNPGSYGIRDLITGGGKGSSYEGKSLFDRVGAGDFGLKTDEFIFGAPSEISQFEGPTKDLKQIQFEDNLPGDLTSYEEIVTNPGSLGQGKIDATSGLLGKGGEMFQALGGSGDVGIADTILGQKAFLGKDGKLSMLKLGSWGVGIVSGIQAGKYADEMEAANAAEQALIDSDNEATQAEIDAARAWAIETFGSMSVYADGGRINKNMGGEMNMGGISSLQTQASDVTPPGMELDLRGGGFIPIGTAEKADDVPARVSKNEFVFTADAVKAAGGGSVNEGAKKMYDTMKRLESQVG